MPSSSRGSQVTVWYSQKHHSDLVQGGVAVSDGHRIRMLKKGSDLPLYVCVEKDPWECSVQVLEPPAGMQHSAMSFQGPEITRRRIVNRGSKNNDRPFREF
jgi:hypothetical protein